jgi:hypothetical protein
MFSNLLTFLDIWTTPKLDPTTSNPNTITVEDARGAAIIYLVIGVVVGPFIHRKLGFAPLF